LGKYYYTTTEQFKKMRFEYLAKEKTVLIGFCAGLFYEEGMLSEYKFVVRMAWNAYLERVAEAERIIKELVLVMPEPIQHERVTLR
jgi:hypothetical protein